MYNMFLVNEQQVNEKVESVMSINYEMTTNTRNKGKLILFITKKILDTLHEVVLQLLKTC